MTENGPETLQNISFQINTIALLSLIYSQGV